MCFFSSFLVALALTVAICHILLEEVDYKFCYLPQRMNLKGSHTLRTSGNTVKSGSCLNVLNSETKFESCWIEIIFQHCTIKYEIRQV